MKMEGWLAGVGRRRNKRRPKSGRVDEEFETKLPVAETKGESTSDSKTKPAEAGLPEDGDESGIDGGLGARGTDEVADEVAEGKDEERAGAPLKHGGCIAGDNDDEGIEGEWVCANLGTVEDE